VDLEHVADVVRGLEGLARDELVELGATVMATTDGEVRFSHPRPERVLARSRLVSAVYRSLEFAVPRPKALLGDAAFRRLSGACRQVAARGPMATFRLAAAGSQTQVFRRLADELGRATGLAEDRDAGELLVRVRRSRSGGWEALLRLTARPLSARGWRVCNLPGGANATVAAAIARLTGGGSFLNLMCGSGTLAIERALAGPGGPYVGVDVSAEAVACTRRNAEAAGVQVETFLDDVVRPDFQVAVPGGAADELFDVVAADAPWGDAVGSHATNEALHRSLLSAAARHLRPGGRFALLTHEVKIAQKLVSGAEGWRHRSALRVEHGGHIPLLLVLEKVG